MADNNIIKKQGIEPLEIPEKKGAMITVPGKVPYEIYADMLKEAIRYKFSMSEYVRFRLMQPDATKVAEENKQLLKKIEQLTEDLKKSKAANDKNYKIAMNNYQFAEDLKARLKDANAYIIQYGKENVMFFDPKKAKQF